MAGLASYKRLLPAGRGSNIAARGMLVVLRNSQSAVLIETVQNQTSGKSGEKYQLVLRKGEKWFAAQEFDGLQLTNQDVDNDQNVEVLVGYGDYQEPPPNVATSDAITGTPTVHVTDANTPVQGENPRRLRILIKADVGNAKSIFINDNQGDGTGMLLDPGESITLQTRGEVSAITHPPESGDDEILYVLEEIYNVAP